MSENTWGTPGAAPTPTDTQSGETTNAWNVSNMANALPEEGAHGTQTPDATRGGTGATTAKGWGVAQPYNYEAYTNDSASVWDGNARVYEYDGEKGEVGPEVPELELELFGDAANRVSHGIDFSKIAEIKVVQESPVHIDSIKTFEGAGLHPVMLRNIELCGYKVPTPIQKFCIPGISAGHDVIAIAQTGSGKTAAYLIPILNKLMGKAKKLAAPRPNPATHRPGIDPPVRAEPLVVIVCPSRELAVQIFNEARKFCYRTMLRPCVVYGGGPLREQMEQLAKGCDILVASPGRLIDFISRPNLLTLSRLRYMVIDEADEMLHADWEDEFNKILCGGDQEEGNVKYMLFSATFPKNARDLAKSHLAENHIRFRVGRAGSTHANIKQEVIYVQPNLKRQAIQDLLGSLEPGRTIIFVNNKRMADELDDFLFHKGFPCTSMHSDRTQKEREAAMRAFRAGVSPILIATGVTARGIDVRNVKYVINYDLPSVDHGGIEEYTHRIGRTGRIGYLGRAMSFYSDKDEPMASVLTRTLLETGQEVPDFLQRYVPEGDALTNLKFEADSDFDETEAQGGGDGGWGQDNEKGGDGGWGGGGDNAWGGVDEATAGTEAQSTAANTDGW